MLIDNKKIIGVKSKNRIYKGHIVVCNADYPYAVENLFNCDIGDNNYTKENIEESIVYEDYLTPLDLKEKFNSYYGNSFGLSHKITQSLYKRPHIKNKEINGLYFIGLSTHPGNGVSIIIDGSKVLSDFIENDYKDCF